MSAVKPLVVVIGLGEMGIVHAHNLAKVRGIRVGVASTRPDVAQTVTKEVCADQIFNSYEDVFSDPDVSAVVIATPPPTHAKLIIKAAKAGKHIFSEKPLGYDLAGIREAVDAVSKSGVRFMAGFMRRWDRGYVAARNALDSGEIGKPIVLKCTSGDPEYPEKYHRGAAQNSMLLDLAVHDIDLARWLTKSEVKSAYVVCNAMTYPTLKELGDVDVAVAMLNMQSGATVVVHLSRALDYGYNVTSELVGVKGTLQIGELKMTPVVTVKEQRRSTDVAWHFAERFEEAFAREMEAFGKLVLVETEELARELVEENVSYASAHDGMMATAVAEALVRSSESGVPEMVEY